LGRLAGIELELVCSATTRGGPAADTDLVDSLGEILRELDPAAVAILLLLPGVTDGRFFARLEPRPSCPCDRRRSCGS